MAAPLSPPFTALSAPISNVAPLAASVAAQNPTPRGTPPSVVPTYLGLLPASLRDSNNAILRTQPNIPAAVSTAISQTRLNVVHEYLWWTSQPFPARPLHQQLMMPRAIVITEQVELHLVCPQGRIFVKPMPPFLLNYAFWTDYLCGDAELHKAACGFLLSYIWIIVNASDFNIAHTSGLLPQNVTWEAWTIFVDSLLTHLGPNMHERVNKRYQFGEIALPGLNAIYRYAPATRGKNWKTGFLYGYGQFALFFKRHFAWLALGFLYMTTILSAMQVGLGTSYLNGNKSFQRASYGFTIFSILLPVAVIARLLFSHLVYFVLFSLGWLPVLRRKKRRGSAV